MKKGIFICIIGILLFANGIFAIPAFAAETSDTSTDGLFPLVFCGRTGQPDCTVCDLLVAVNKIKNLIFFFVVPVIGTIMVVWAGFLYVLSRGTPAKVQEANSILANMFWGALIIGFSWLITNTIIQSLAKEDNIARSWTKVECRNSDWPSTGTGTGTNSRPSGTLSEADARAQLKAAGIGINWPNSCPAGQTSGCTSFEGIKQSTVDAIVLLGKTCGCSIVVTAGTEHGDPSSCGHREGCKVDLRLNEGLNDYIEKNFKDRGFRSDGAHQYLDTATGVLYAREGDHWDVLVK
jgi:hypothetical protein